jgi:ABC-type transport system substrate-binding protein
MTARPFTADDVIFSYERAKGDGSDMKSYVGQIKEIKKTQRPQHRHHHQGSPFPSCPR